MLNVFQKIQLIFLSLVYFDIVKLTVTKFFCLILIVSTAIIVLGTSFPEHW